MTWPELYNINMSDIVQQLEARIIQNNIKDQQCKGESRGKCKAEKGSCIDREWTGAVLLGLIITPKRAALTQWPRSVHCSHRAEFKYWVAPLCGPQLRVQGFQIGSSPSTNNEERTSVSYRKVDLEY